MGTFKLCDCYYFTRLVVRVFNGDFYLSCPAFVSGVTSISDIGDLQEITTDPNEPVIEGAKIVAVKKLNVLELA